MRIKRKITISFKQKKCYNVLQLQLHLNSSLYGSYVADDDDDDDEDNNNILYIKKLLYSLITGLP